MVLVGTCGLSGTSDLAALDIATKSGKLDGSPHFQRHQYLLHGACSLRSADHPVRVCMAPLRLFVIHQHPTDLEVYTGCLGRRSLEDASLPAVSRLLMRLHLTNHDQ